MDDDRRVSELLELLGLNDAARRQELVRLGSEGPLRLEPEQPANFRLDSTTVSDDEDAFAELA